MSKNIYPPLLFAELYGENILDYYCNNHDKDKDNLTFEDMKECLNERNDLMKLMKHNNMIPSNVDINMQMLSHECAIHWRKNKQVYNFSEEFVNLLNETPLDFILEPSMISTLPYDVFCIEFGNNYGFIFVGDNSEITGIKDDIFLGLILLDPVENNDITTSNVNYRIMIAKENNITIKDFINGFEVKEDIDKLEKMVQMTLYLAAENAIIKENEANKKTYKKPTNRIKNKYSEIRKWDAGVIRENVYKESYKNITESTIRQYKRKSPREHWRRAHWQRYKVGPEKKVVLRWIQPILVNAHHKNKELPTVISKVKG